MLLLISHCIAHIILYVPAHSLMYNVRWYNASVCTLVQLAAMTFTKLYECHYTNHNHCLHLSVYKDSTASTRHTSGMQAFGAFRAKTQLCYFLEGPLDLA